MSDRNIVFGETPFLAAGVCVMSDFPENLRQTLAVSDQLLQISSAVVQHTYMANFYYNLMQFTLHSTLRIGLKERPQKSGKTSVLTFCW